MLLLLLPFVILLYGCYLWVVGRGYRHLPGNVGTGFPFFGNIYQSMRFSFLSQDEILSKLEKPLSEEGGLYCTWLYCLPAIVVSNPKIVEKLVIHPAISNKDPLVYENVPNLWKGPFTMARADKEWKMRRKEFTSTVSQPKLDKYHRTFVEASQKMVNMMKQEKGVFDILKHVQLTTMDIILETHYGCEVNMEDKYELFKATKWGEVLLYKSFLNPFIGIYLNTAILISYPTKYCQPFNKLADMLTKGVPKHYRSLKIEFENWHVLYGCTLFKYLFRGEALLYKTFLNPLIGFYLNMATLISYPTKYFRPIIKLAKMCIDKAMSAIKENQIIQGNKDLLYGGVIIKRNLSMNKSRKEMKAEVIDLVLVGSHTTSNCAVNALYFLASLPKIQEKAWLEQQEIFGESDREPTVDDIRRMEYLERVVKETLRFVSSTILVRKTENEINIDGIIFPSDSMILLCSRMMRMDKQFWENPTKFDPDRYLKEGPHQNFKQAFSHFGFGTRNCPGGQYAINKVKVIISMVLRHFQMLTNKKFEDIKLTSHIMMVAEDYNISVIRRPIKLGNEDLKK